MEESNSELGKSPSLTAPLPFHWAVVPILFLYLWLFIDLLLRAPNLSALESLATCLLLTALVGLVGRWRWAYILSEVLGKAAVVAGVAGLLLDAELRDGVILVAGVSQWRLIATATRGQRPACASVGD